ncbi:MAG: ATP-binding protein [Chitinophagales bacterium]
MRLFTISKVGQITSSIMIAIVIIIAISAVSVYYNRNFEENSELVQHTYEVMIELEVFMQELINAESHARAYWLTSSDQFIDKFETSLNKAKSSFEEAQLLTGNNQAQQKNLLELQRLSINRIEVLEKNITLFDTMQDYELKIFAINAGVRSGSVYMDSIRQSINVLKNEESILLEQRLVNFYAASKSSIIFIIISAILALIIIMLAYFTLRREYFDKVDSEEKFKTIFNESEDFIFITNDKLRFKDVNALGVRLLGYSREELLKKKLTDLFANERSVQAVETATQFDQGINDYEVSILTKSNKEIPMLLNLSAKKAGKNSKQGSLLDLTERIADEKSKQNMLLFSSTGRIARIIGHEVRNPLTNINLSLAQMKADGDVSVQDREMYFDIIERNSDRITQLVTQLLDSTKFTELVRQPVAVVKLLDDTILMANDRIHLKKIKLIKEYNRVGDCTIVVDGEKIKIALLNIIINAIEAMETEKGVLHIDSETDNKECKIIISDNGAGIPEKNLKKLFQPFFTSKPKGTGLGLTSAHNIILHHKGNIKVESAVHKGTKFIISLPLVPGDLEDSDIEIE